MMQSPDWKTALEFDDITYKKSNGVARIAFNRPNVRNAFRPHTTSELIKAFYDAQEDTSIGVVLLSAEGPSTKDGIWSFCSGGDHSLHVVCDMTLASKEHAIFKQTDADVTSFDGGYGSAYLAKMVGQKKAREIFFLGRNYSAQEAFEMGMVNAVVPHEELEATAYQWAQEVLEKSPTSIKMLKFAMNLTDDGMVGQQVFAGEATRLAYMTKEAKEGRNAFLEKRKPDFGKNKWIP